MALKGEAMDRNASRPTALEGENIATTHWEDARHWMSVYADLIQFKLGLLDRIERELPRLSPEARRAAGTDRQIITDQMKGYQDRLDLWYERLWDLQGLRVDTKQQVLRYRDKVKSLTTRECQLLQFLLNHPHRFYTPNQIVSQAWADPELRPEQVRNYAARLRKVFTRMQIPCDLVNRPRRGYSLQLRVNS